MLLVSKYMQKSNKYTHGCSKGTQSTLTVGEWHIDIQLPTCTNIYAMRTYTIRAIIVMMCDLYNRMLNMFGRDLDMEFMWERMEDGLIRLSVSTHRELPDGLYIPPSQKNSLLQNPLFNIFSTWVDEGYDGGDNGYDNSHHDANRCCHHRAIIMVWITKCII